MNSDLWNRAKEILERALDVPTAERADFLDRECGDDSELREELESLLDAEAEALDFIEDPVLSLRPEDRDTEITGHPVPRQFHGDNSGKGERIGPYRVLEEIGRGGMGRVFKAIRADAEFEKVVAIKLLKRGMDTEAIVRRFRHERQILANLAHPNIAELFDGGTTRDGLPYFVLEYVEGLPIDRYCDEQRLTIRQRLRLFRKVCGAVHFAHRNLVVHRDLKPGNILVTAEGEPKLLDFGIAKLLAPGVSSGAETTALQITVPGSEPMTPDYASPEQIAGRAITTASDIYSLGVLLYRLLTGHSPYRPRSGSVRQLFRIIAEEDPHRPSAVILLREEARVSGGSNTVVTPESVSRARQTDPRALRRQLTGDLDSILLQTLRKEPDARYSSVEQFSEDLRLHLEGLPIAARRGSFSYQAMKFVRRNRIKFAAALAALLVVFLGARSVVSERQAQRDKQVVRSLSALYETLQKLEPYAAEDPSFAQELRELVAQNVDAKEVADILSVQAADIRSRGGFKTAELLDREAASMILRLFPREEAISIRFMNNLATTLELMGKYEESEKIFREALELRIAAHGRKSEEVARSLNNLGVMLQNKGELALAEPYLQESLETRSELLSPEHFAVGLAHNNYAFFLQANQRYENAQSHYQEALRIFRARTGEMSVPVATVLRNMATLSSLSGDTERAEELARQALAIFKKAYFKHWRIADAESVLGEALVARGLVEEAEPLLRDSFTIIRSTKGENARHTREAQKRLEFLEEARRQGVE